MTSHLVIGASGQVGRELFRTLAARGRGAVGTYCSTPVPGLVRLDVRDRAAVAALVARERPRVVYLPAASANVELCERDPAGTRAVNVEGSRNVLDAAAAAGARTVVFSSDYVFDGEAGPYREEDAPAPLSEYGRQKLELEQLALARPRTLVVRTTVVYGWEPQGKNFVVSLVGALRAGRRFRVPADQIGSPTYAPDLADAAVELADRGVEGLLHVVGSSVVSRHELALAAADAFALDRDLVAAAATRDLGQVAPRPLRAGMIPARAQALLSFPLLDHRAGLAAMAAAEPAARKEAS